MVWRDAGDVSIVAYVVPAAGPRLDPAEVTTDLRSVLPAYMVPDRVVTLDALPVTPNGKVDRRALPAPQAASRGPVASDGTRDDLESMLAVWCSVLDLPVVDADADFFEIGGHSLRALLLLAAIEDSFGVDLRLADLVAAPTPRSLTAAAMTPRSGAARRRGHRARPWRSRRPDAAPHPGRGRRALRERLPDAGAPPPVDRLRVVTYEVPGLVPGTVPMASIARLADWYAARVAAAQPEGPLLRLRSFLRRAHRRRGGPPARGVRPGRSNGSCCSTPVCANPRHRPLKRTRVLLSSTARRWRGMARARRCGPTPPPAAGSRPGIWPWPPRLRSSATGPRPTGAR